MSDLDVLVGLVRVRRALSDVEEELRGDTAYLGAEVSSLIESVDILVDKIKTDELLQELREVLRAERPTDQVEHDDAGASNDPGRRTDTTY